jgi:TRAP-type C4-dicarboxylate transport system permease small subunit
MEMEFGKVEFLGIKSGYLVTIIPFGFALIAFRFLVLAIQNAADLLGHKGV